MMNCFYKLYTLIPKYKYFAMISPKNKSTCSATNFFIDENALPQIESEQ